LSIENENIFLLTTTTLRAFRSPVFVRAIFPRASAASCITRHTIAASVGRANRDRSRVITMRFDGRAPRRARAQPPSAVRSAF